MPSKKLPPARYTRRHPQTIISAAISAALATVPGFVLADEASGNTLEEIIVTANYREQSVLDVPYNISAVNGAALEQSKVDSLTDIARVVPGVTIPDLGPRGNSGNNLITIRGLNINDPIASSYLPWGSVPTVSTYVDDVPLFVNLKLDDIQRVEVLRGPQGTLYGSGAVGGTLKILHNAPDLEHFSVEATGGSSQTNHASDPSYEAKFVLNAPIVKDALAARVSVGYGSTSGFIDATHAVVFDSNVQPVLADPANPLTSGLVTRAYSNVDKAHDLSLRAALYWKKSPAFDATLAYQRQDSHSDGFSQQTAGLHYQTDVLVPHQPEHRVVDLESLTMTGDFGFATVTSSTSYSQNKVDNVYDESQYVLFYESLSPYIYGEYPRTTSIFYLNSVDTSFTQELRLASKEGGAWDYTVGAYFQHQTQHLTQRETIPGYAAWTELPGSADSVSTPGSVYANMGDFFQMYYGGTRPSQVQPTDTDFIYQRASGFLDHALFGELTRHITHNWQVTAGGRVFWQSFDQNLLALIPFGGPVYSTLPPPQNLTDTLGTTRVSRHQNYHSDTIKFNTSYQLSAASRIYAVYSEGFRHGGINALPIGACIFCENPSIVPYKSDTVQNYEVGIKGTLNNWLRYSAAVYRIDWKNPQIQAFAQDGNPAVVNGAAAQSQGLELELNARFGGGWSADLGFGLTDSKLTKSFSVVDVVPGFANATLVSGVDGDRLPNVPRQTLTADLAYAWTTPNGLRWDAHLGGAYRSDINTQLNSSVVGYKNLGGFTTLNGGVGATFSKAWRAMLYVNNITNALGITSEGALFRNYDDPRYHIQNPIRPRTIGLTVTYSYD